MLKIICDKCQLNAEAAPGDHSWVCPNCESSLKFYRCRKCLAVVGRTIADGAACPRCGDKHTWSFKAWDAVTATELSDYLREHGLVFDSESGGVALADCVVLGGHGHDLPASSRCSLLFGEGSVLITPAASRQSFSLPYDQVEGVAVSGAGATVSGGGFIGGGLGVEGTAAGLAMSSILNGITTTTGMDTVVDVQGTETRVIVAYLKETPRQLEVRLAPAMHGIEKQTNQPPASDPATSISSELTSLAGLHQSGALTDAEFAAAKQRIIDGSSG